MANTYKGYGLTPQGNAVPYSGGSAPASVLEAENAQKLAGVPAGDYALKTDTVANAQTLGGKAPEYYLQPRNLLDNSDFRNGRFIVQAGLNGLHGSTVYLGDRWIGDSRITAEQKQDHIVLTSTAQFAYVVQKVHVEGGKTYTLAIKSTGADCYLGFDVGNAKERHHERDVYTLQVDVPYDSNLIEVRLYPAFKDGGGTANIYWAALYEDGYTAKTLPPYITTHPRIENLKLGNPVQPVNLLDNSDWRVKENIINQRGQDSYVITTSGPRLDAIDRWYTYATNLSMTLNENSLTISEGGSSYIQDLPAEIFKENTVYTLAVKETNGNITVLNAKPGDETAVQPPIVFEWAGSDGIGFRSRLYSGTFEWMALYEGTYTAETLPPYVPKGYSAELLACGVADKGTPFFEADALTLEEIAASTDLTGKIPDAAAVKELHDKNNFIFVGGSGETNSVAVDLKTLNLSNGLYEFVGRYQHAFISLVSGRYHLFGVANYPDLCSLTEDGLLNLYVGGWYTDCFCRRFPVSF